MIAHGDAIMMRQYGGPDVLRVEKVPLAPVQASEVRIRAIASAVNHSDLEIRAGNWPVLKREPFPYTPGLETVGQVVETGASVTEVHVGDRVMTMMQGLGGVAQRPGGYAEYVTVDAGAVAPLSEDANPIDMAALGLAGVTAFEGLRRLGEGLWK
jgi:NADPH:quinone reductase